MISSNRFFNNVGDAAGIVRNLLKIRYMIASAYSFEEKESILARADAEIDGFLYQMEVTGTYPDSLVVNLRKQHESLKKLGHVK